MTKPKNALVEQYKKLFEVDGVELNITEDAVSAVAKKAIDLKTGARGLRTILENVMLDCMFEIPSDDTIKEVVIDKEVVEGSKKPQIIHKQIA